MLDRQGFLVIQVPWDSQDLKGNQEAPDQLELLEHQDLQESRGQQEPRVKEEL